MHIVSKNNSETINLQTVPLEKFRNLDKDFAETFDQINPSVKIETQIYDSIENKQKRPF